MRYRSKFNRGRRSYGRRSFGQRKRFYSRRRRGGFKRKAPTYRIAGGWL